MSEDMGGVEQQLYDIDCTLMRAVDNLERIANALERMAPQGSERELIALQLWTTLDVELEASFRHADRWIEERDRQRAQQAEQRRAE